MTKIQTSKTQYKHVQSTESGQGDVHLWIFFMAFIIVLLFLLPFIGIFWSFAMVAALGLMSATSIASIQNYNPEILMQSNQIIYEMASVPVAVKGLSKRRALKQSSKFRVKSFFKLALNH